MKVSQAVTPFINYCRAERDSATSTLAKYQECFDCWLSPWLDDKDLADISRLDVLNLRQAMTERQLSIARQYSIVMCLKSFLKFCRSILGDHVSGPGRDIIARVSGARGGVLDQ